MSHHTVYLCWFIHSWYKTPHGRTHSNLISANIYTVAMLLYSYCQNTQKQIKHFTQIIHCSWTCLFWVFILILYTHRLVIYEKFMRCSCTELLYSQTEMTATSSLRVLKQTEWQSEQQFILISSLLKLLPSDLPYKKKKLILCYGDNMPFQNSSFTSINKLWRFCQWRFTRKYGY